jgi:hypothetical protein
MKWPFLITLHKNTKIHRSELVKIEKEMRKYSILVMEMRCIFVKTHHVDGCYIGKQLTNRIDVKFEFAFSPIFYHSSIVVQKSFVFIEKDQFSPVHLDGF